ncbi:MAG: hypothetical protein GY795_45710 [Desulfobacterales bacterium]|nr:hypothetical protein [Desulfobacterales bacterium]
MDDWVIIAPTRWKLRNAVRIVNETPDMLKAEKHPDKTFIGRGERGFDFLGYFLKLGEITVSGAAIRRCAERIARLYEQGANLLRIGQYVLRWSRWLSPTVGSFFLVRFFSSFFSFQLLCVDRPLFLLYFR